MAPSSAWWQGQPMRASAQESLHEGDTHLILVTHMLIGRKSIPSLPGSDDFRATIRPATEALAATNRVAASRWERARTLEPPGEPAAAVAALDNYPDGARSPQDRQDARPTEQQDPVPTERDVALAGKR